MSSPSCSLLSTARLSEPAVSLRCSGLCGAGPPEASEIGPAASSTGVVAVLAATTGGAHVGVSVVGAATEMCAEADNGPSGIVISASVIIVGPSDGGVTTPGVTGLDAKVRNVASGGIECIGAIPDIMQID